MSLILKRPRFDPLAVKLRKIKRGLHRQAAAGAIRDVVEERIDQQFDRRRDPEGNRWAPRKKPTGNWPLLEKTGQMRRLYHIEAKTTGITVTNSQDYASYHQTGTSRMPARRVLPKKTPPAEWRREIDRRIKKELDKL